MSESKLDKLVVSFVHGYNEIVLKLEGEVFPSLLVYNGKKNSTYDYPFPRNISDFLYHKDLLKGIPPLKGSKNFKRLPRFGLTGIMEVNDFIFAGSWNSVYKIKKSDFRIDSIISNNLMSDLHGIYADENKIITALTGKDTIVISDHEGVIIDHFTVKKDLTVIKDETIENTDWRFLSKQFRGSTGNWHFNYVQVINDEIWLTSRNTNSFVIYNRNTNKCRMKTMNLCTPALIHDGLLYEDNYYFTSIDGKIIIAKETDEEKTVREWHEGLNLYNRDLETEVIKINETNYAKEPNWCRGISKNENNIYVTIDGRYDSDLSFGVLKINERKDAKIVTRLNWSEIGDASKIKYVTGFDIININ